MTDDPYYRSAALYDLRYSHGSNIDVEFWCRLRARCSAQRVLELGCGSGRVTLPLARAGLADGVRIVGLDLATAMLAGARAKLAAESPAVQAAVRLVEGDMRAFDLGERFDLVMIPFNTLGHLQTIDDQLACFAAARAHLAPGGRFAVEVMQPDLDDLRQAVVAPKRSIIGGAATDPTTGDRLVRHRRRRYHRDSQLLVSHYVDEIIATTGDMIVETADLALHVYFPRELDLLFRLAGFEVEQRFGDYDDGPFTTDSDYLIVAGRPIDVRRYP